MGRVVTIIVLGLAVTLVGELLTPSHAEGFNLRHMRKRSAQDPSRKPGPTGVGRFDATRQRDANRTRIERPIFRSRRSRAADSRTFPKLLRSARLGSARPAGGQVRPSLASGMLRSATRAPMASASMQRLINRAKALNTTPARAISDAVARIISPPLPILR